MNGRRNIFTGLQAVKLLQETFSILNWGCFLMQVVLYNGCETVEVVVVTLSI